MAWLAHKPCAWAGQRGKTLQIAPLGLVSARSIMGAAFPLTATPHLPASLPQLAAALPPAPFLTRGAAP